MLITVNRKLGHDMVLDNKNSSKINSTLLGQESFQGIGLIRHSFDEVDDMRANGILKCKCILS